MLYNNVHQAQACNASLLRGPWQGARASLLYLLLLVPQGEGLLGQAQAQAMAAAMVRERGWGWARGLAPQAHPIQ